MTISQRIYQLITELGIKPYQLATDLGLSAPSVYRWFKKKNGTTPSLENIIKFLTVYDISPHEFLEGFDFPQLTNDQQNLLNDWVTFDREEKELVLQLFHFIKTRKQ